MLDHGHALRAERQIRKQVEERLQTDLSERKIIVRNEVRFTRAGPSAAAAASLY